MGQYNVPPDLLKTIQDIKKRLQSLANTQATPVYTMATRPSANKVGPGQIIFVQDATAGQRFQGWDSTAVAWVPLG